MNTSQSNGLERASDPALPAVAQTSGATEPESIHAQKAPAPTATVETSARHAFALEQEYAVRTATIERRGEIIREIAQLETAQGISALRRLFDRERREELRLEIVSAVGAIENEQLLPAKLQFFSRATEPQTPRLLREVSAIALSELDDPRAEALLRGLQSDPDAELRATVRQLLHER